jgi:hypothetical protein
MLKYTAPRKRSSSFPHLLEALDHRNELAEKVVANCPFAATFGFEGEGEGLVWKPIPQLYNANPALWFKTKGGEFKSTFSRSPRNTVSFDTVEEKTRAAAAAAGMWSSEQRIEQGWDVLREQNVERGLQGLRSI